MTNVKKGITESELVDKIKSAEDILVISNKDLDLSQLGASIGLVDILHHMEKNAVFVHGQVIPEALDFLQTSEVMNPDVECLRDVEIKFDRDKVIKFRYVEADDQYNILLTPSHRTNLSVEDFDFSKSDNFNVDLILAVGIENASQIATVISQHNQLMHELPIVTILGGQQKQPEIDADFWQKGPNFSIGEMIYGLSQTIGMTELEDRTSNALMISLIDHTNHFKDETTYSRTMHIGGELIKFGADIPLITKALIDIDYSLSGVTEAEAVVDEMVTEDLVANEEVQVQSNEKKKKKRKLQRAMITEDLVSGGIQIGKGQTTKKKEEAEKHKIEQLKINAEGTVEFVDPEDSADSKAPVGLAQKTDSSLDDLKNVDQATEPVQPVFDMAQPLASNSEPQGAAEAIPSIDTQISNIDNLASSDQLSTADHNLQNIAPLDSNASSPVSPTKNLYNANSIDLDDIQAPDMEAISTLPAIASDQNGADVSQDGVAALASEAVNPQDALADQAQPAPALSNSYDQDLNLPPIVDEAHNQEEYNSSTSSPLSAPPLASMT